MAWYDVPKVKVTYVYNDDGEKRGVVFSPSDFEKLVETLEDFHDIKVVEGIERRDDPTYTLEEVMARVGVRR